MQNLSTFTFYFNTKKSSGVKPLCIIIEMDSVKIHLLSMGHVYEHSATNSFKIMGYSAIDYKLVHDLIIISQLDQSGSNYIAQSFVDDSRVKRTLFLNKMKPDSILTDSMFKNFNFWKENISDILSKYVDKRIKAKEATELCVKLMENLFLDHNYKRESWVDDVFKYGVDVRKINNLKKIQLWFNGLFK